MRRKLFVSVGAVIGLSVLSVIALVNSSDKVEAEFVMDTHKNISEAVIIPEKETADSIAVPVFDNVPEIRGEKWDVNDRYLLAKIAMAEAESEDTEGKALVMLVVLNRVSCNDFPDSIEEVIYQSEPSIQFSPVANGRFEMVEPDADCWAALDMITLDQWDESQGALYFESKSASTWHSDNLQFLFQHGNHLFYTDKEAEHE